MSIDTKQIIVVRNDLRSKLRHGKLAAQVAHASLAAFIAVNFSVSSDGDRFDLTLPLDEVMRNWLASGYAKIVLKCDDEDHLFRLTDHCKTHNLKHFLVRDEGRTVFQEPTFTCLGIGPALSSDLVDTFSDLQLY